MKLSAFIVTAFILLAVPAIASDLVFLKDGEVVKKLTLKEIKKGQMKLGDAFIGSVDKTLFNAWRGYERTYRGYSFSELLGHVYGEDWILAKTISFRSLDGYKQIANVKAMLRSAKGKSGLIAYTETGKNGFTKFKRENKVIDPGPLYLVWSHFEEKDKASHGDNLKWPYQLKTVEINSKK